jgi:hypothetical protein
MMMVLPNTRQDERNPSGTTHPIQVLFPLSLSSPPFFASYLETNETSKFTTFKLYGYCQQAESKKKAAECYICVLSSSSVLFCQMGSTGAWTNKLNKGES